jgi:hypothetical protein
LIERLNDHKEEEAVEEVVEEVAVEAEEDQEACQPYHHSNQMP